MKIQVVTVTPETAKKWIDEWYYPFQRNLRERRVDILAAEMVAGRFLQNTVIRVVNENGKLFMVDGQHRLHAVIKSGCPIGFVVLVTDSESPSDTAMQYSNIDINQTRTFSDMFSAHNLSEKFGLMKRQIDKLGAAVLLIEGSFNATQSRTVSRSEVLDKMCPYVPAATEYIELVQSAPSELKGSELRAATFGLALITFRYSKLFYGDKVNEFWLGAVFDDGLRIGDPRKVANVHLRTTKMSGGFVGAGKKGVNASYSSRYLANCFNAFIKGKRLLQTKVPDSSTPINILGSPFKG